MGSLLWILIKLVLAGLVLVVCLRVQYFERQPATPDARMDCWLRGLFWAALICGSAIFFSYLPGRGLADNLPLPY